MDFGIFSWISIDQNSLLFVIIRVDQVVQKWKGWNGKQFSSNLVFFLPLFVLLCFSSSQVVLAFLTPRFDRLVAWFSGRRIQIFVVGSVFFMDWSSSSATFGINARDDRVSVFSFETERKRYCISNSFKGYVFSDRIQDNELICSILYLASCIKSIVSMYATEVTVQIQLELVTD